MSKEIDNFDEVVEKITQRVAERLKQMGISPDLAGQAVACTLLSGGECESCGLCVVQNRDSVDNIVDTGATRIGANPGIPAGVDTRLAGMIDHTLLKPDASREELAKLCEEARQYHFATVCVNSSNISYTANLLKGSSVRPIAVVGFPLGAASTQSKAYEAKEAIRAGADEIDMVINIGALKSRDYQTVYEDIRQVVQASHPRKVKVIIETASLDHDEKVIACTLSKTAGAAFVKTSTGFGGGGATVEDIALMRSVVGGDMEVKASGGIRTKEDAESMIKAGANRIGASASVAIVTDKKAARGKY